MSDKRTTPEEPSGNRRRKRAAPTIDLTATEVPPEAAAAPEQQAAPESPVHEPPKQESPAQETPSPEPEAAPAAREQVNARDGASGFGAYFSGPALAGGISGAALTTLVLFALWLTGLVPIRYAGSTATRARVTALEMELKDLQKRPPSPATAQTVDTQAVDALTQRVTKMEGALAALPKNSAADPALAQRVADADNAMKSLGVALAALNRRSDTVAADAQQAKARAEAAEKAVTDLRSNVQDVSKNASAAVSPSELSALRDRVAALEQSAKTAHEQIAAIATKAAAPDKAARLALTAASIRDAARGGVSYANELAQAKALGGDEKLLAPLAPFASTGVPSAKVLAQQLSALLPAMVKTSGAQAPSGGFLERLQANAEHLVRIRPVDAPPGNDASSVLARLEAEAAKADIDAALADIAKLPERQRQQVADWVTKAVARQKALAAAQQFAAASAAALGKS